MKIVIISKAFYPLQSARALRATELSQQFVKMGHDVTVYTVANLPDYSSYTKQTGVKVRIIPTRWIITSTPHSIVHAFLVKSLSVLLGGLLEFPSIELLFKIPRIITKEQNVDLLITVAFPYPTHWGAAYAKKRNRDTFPKIWVSDCGDPYMGNDVQKPMFYFKYLERFWGDMTDYVTIPIEGAASAYYANVQSKIRVIPQGFDFSSVRIDTSFNGNPIPNFVYTGTLFPGYRDLTTFLEYLCTIKEDFRFYVYTKNPETVNPFKSKLGDKLIVSDYIPRLELLYRLSQMDFLVNLTNKSTVQSPSKLIDYGLSRRPVLDISTPFEEYEPFSSFMKKDYSKSHPRIDTEKYNIINVANQFLDLTK